jgi:hypothetical protein
LRKSSFEDGTVFDQLIRKDLHGLRHIYQAGIDTCADVRFFEVIFLQTGDDINGGRDFFQPHILSYSLSDVDFNFAGLRHKAPARNHQLVFARRKIAERKTPCHIGCNCLPALFKLDANARRHAVICDQDAPRNGTRNLGKNNGGAEIEGEGNEPDKRSCHAFPFVESGCFLLIAKPGLYWKEGKQGTIS